MTSYTSNLDNALAACIDEVDPLAGHSLAEVAVDGVDPVPLSEDEQAVLDAIDDSFDGDPPPLDDEAAAQLVNELTLYCDE